MWWSWCCTWGLNTGNGARYVSRQSPGVVLVATPMALRVQVVHDRGSSRLRPCDTATLKTMADYDWVCFSRLKQRFYRLRSPFEMEHIYIYIWFATYIASLCILNAIIWVRCLTEDWRTQVFACPLGHDHSLKSLKRHACFSPSFLPFPMLVTSSE